MAKFIETALAATGITPIQKLVFIAAAASAGRICSRQDLNDAEVAAICLMPEADVTTELDALESGGRFGEAVSPEDAALFDQVWAAYPHAPNGRSIKKMAKARFCRLPARTKAAFPDAAKRYGASLRERDIEFTPGLQNWISKGAFENWIRYEQPAAGQQTDIDRRAAGIRAWCLTGRWNEELYGPMPLYEELDTARELMNAELASTPAGAKFL